MSVAIGASAAGARAYTATASQGLLFMAEAVFNASGLGLPIVMTVANRAIGAPINIWNDHTDAMSPARLRLDPALRRDQPGSARPAHPGIPAGRGAVAAGDGVHGRLHPHARRTSASTCRRRRRSMRSCRRSSRARCSIRPSRCRSARWSGPEAFTEVRYLAHAKQMQALELIPAWADEFQHAFGRDAGGLVRAYRLEDAETDRRRARLGARHDQGRGRRDARERREDRRARHLVLPPVAARRGARARSRQREARRGAGEEPRGRHGRHRFDQRAHRASRAAGRRYTT